MTTPRIDLGKPARVHVDTIAGAPWTLTAACTDIAWAEVTAATITLTPTAGGDLITFALTVDPTAGVAALQQTTAQTAAVPLGAYRWRLTLRSADPQTDGTVLAVGPWHVKES